MEERQKYLNTNTQSQQHNNRNVYNHNHNHDGGVLQQSGNIHLGDEQHHTGTGFSQPFQHDVTCYKCGERG